MPKFESLYEPCSPIPDHLTTPQFIFDAHHPARPHRAASVPWLIDSVTGTNIGFEIYNRTYSLANAIYRRWGLGEDDVVCMFSPNHIEYPTAIWAAHRLGAIVSCANPAYKANELVHQLSTIKACLVIAHPENIFTVLAATRECGISTDRIILIDKPTVPLQMKIPTISDLISDDLSTPLLFTERNLAPGEAKTKLAFLSFSSGTTGKPKAKIKFHSYRGSHNLVVYVSCWVFKAVAVSHYAVIANVIQKAKFHKINEEYTSWEKRRFRPGDVSLGVLPFYHIYGLVVILHFALFAGLSLVVVPKFNFIDFLKAIDKYKVTHLFLVPPQIVLLCKHPATKNYDLSRIRFCVSGAASLSAELTNQLIKVLPNASIGQGYGMTETCGTIAMVPTNQFIGTLGSVGRIMPGCRVRVVKKEGSLAGYDEPGELYISGPQIALGYYKNEEATKETFVDGWVRTGDEVSIARNGDLFVIDRLKELIKVRGFQIAPAELEGHLLEHPDISDACVVGIPDDYSGEVPLAFIVLKVGAAQRIKSEKQEEDKLMQAILKHVSDNKVRYKWLDGGIEFVDSIPKNPSGKLLRRLSRDRAREIVARRKRSRAKL